MGRGGFELRLSSGVDSYIEYHVAMGSKVERRLFGLCLCLNSIHTYTLIDPKQTSTQTFPNRPSAYYVSNAC